MFYFIQTEGHNIYNLFFLLCLFFLISCQLFPLSLTAFSIWLNHLICGRPRGSVPYILIPSFSLSLLDPFRLHDQATVMLHTFLSKITLIYLYINLITLFEGKEINSKRANMVMYADTYTLSSTNTSHLSMIFLVFFLGWAPTNQRFHCMWKWMETPIITQVAMTFRNSGSTLKHSTLTQVQRISTNK